MKSCKFLLLITVVMIFMVNLPAINWGGKEVECPICKQKNSFGIPTSYGSYIYHRPSKYQYVFWPLTDRHVLYSCKKCYLTCYMWDFRKIPHEKIKALQEMLHKVKIDRVGVDYYTEIPMITRLKVAEKVYSFLDKDKLFWCRFYRTLAYHYDEDGQYKLATQARIKALRIIEDVLIGGKNIGIKKELLLISGAMRYFLDDIENARKDFKQALQLTYSDPTSTEKNNSDNNRYLTGLLLEYIQNDERYNPLKKQGTILVEQQLRKAYHKSNEELIDDLQKDTTYLPVKIHIVRMITSEKNPNFIPQFMYAVHHKNKEMKLRGLVGLRRLGPKAAPVVANLISVLNEPELNSDLKYELLTTLGEIGDKAEPAIGYIIAILRSKDEKIVKLRSITTLEKIGKKPQIVISALLEVFNYATDRDLIIAAIDSIGNMGEHAQKAIPSLINALGETEEYPKINEHAAKAIEKIGEKAIPFLRKALETRNQDVRKQADEIIRKFEKQKDANDK